MRRDDAARDASAPEDPACDSGWTAPLPGSVCGSRALFTAVRDVGAVHLVRLARASGGDVALLYDARTDAGATLTLAIVDPVAQIVRRSRAIASGPAFDAAALSYDGVGTLSVAFHAGAGTSVEYQALDDGLEGGAPETVVADASSSLLAVSSIPGATADAGPVGPLGLVPGTVGMAWSGAPPEPDDLSVSYLHLFSRQAAGGWSEVETYGYTEPLGDLGLFPNPQRGVVASAIAYSADVDAPFEACTWQMAGRVSQCELAGQLYGLSMAIGAGDAFLAYTFPDPDTGTTTLDVATDSDGSYTFPQLTTVATFPAAVSGGDAEPRAAFAGATVVAAVAYPTRTLAFRLDFATWNTETEAVTTEQVTTVEASTAATPPLDLIVDGHGVPTFAMSDPGSGSILIGRAVLP